MATPLPGASVGAGLQPCLARAATCLLLAFASCASCTPGPPQPASLDTANDACRHCRMAVSDRHFAAQIVARGDEPLFFDDIACMRDYLAEHRDVSREAAIYVADHRTLEWLEARAAVYTRVPALATPMGSGLAAHRDERSRDQDPAVKGGEAVAVNDVLGPWARTSGRR